MSLPRLYELRVFEGTRPVRTANRLLESLDLTDPVGVRDLLRRHLLAVAERETGDRRRAHRYHLDVHEMRGDRADRDWSFQFSVPVEV